MTNAETIWNVISWYYGNSTPIGLLLIVMTVYLLAKKKEYRYYTVGGLFLVFNTEPVDLSRHYKTRRGKHLLSFSLDVSGIVACSMVFVKNPGTRREWVDKSSMCDNGRLSGVPIFGNGDF